MQKTFSIQHKHTNIQLRHVEGNVQIQNWDNAEIQVTIAGEARTFWQERQTIYLHDVTGDVSIMIPRFRKFFSSQHVDLDAEDIQQHLTVGQIGDVRLTRIQGQVAIREVWGDLTLDEVQENVQVDHVGGDLDARSIPVLTALNVGGDLQLQNTKKISIDNVGGDADLRTVQNVKMQNVGGEFSAMQVSESVLVQNVGGDAEIIASPEAIIELRHIGGDFHCPTPVKMKSSTVGGDLEISLRGLADPQARITVGGTARIILTTECQLKLHLITGGEIRTNNSRYSRYSGITQLQFGEAQEELSLTAGGDILLHSDAHPNEGEAFTSQNSWRDFKYDWREIEHHWQDVSKEIRHMGKTLAKELHRSFGD
jgi:DUF4097 and DUF4098 domain-containing protein YvlB